MGFLIGQLMKATEGKANPKMANDIIRNELAKTS
jgi:Asp-tRNA(Asn)/Glu-tRNA(Gln) amidotransferase B subunit